MGTADRKLCTVWPKDCARGFSMTSMVALVAQQANKAALSLPEYASSSSICAARRQFGNLAPRSALVRRGVSVR
jgi:hypothetical protein